MYPTQEQWVKIRKAFGATIFTYNRCVEAIKNKAVQPNKKDLKAYTLNSDADVIKDHPWLLDASYDMRDGALMNVLDAKKELMTKIKNKTLTTFNMKFRSRKQPSRTIRLYHKRYKKKGVFFPQFFGNEPFRRGDNQTTHCG